jgi:hypothetical protein
MRKRIAVGILAGIFLAAPAFGAIEVKNPLTKVVKQVGEEIYVGKIAAVAADGAGFTLGEVEALKGKPAESIEVTAKEELVKSVGKGTPVVVYSGLGRAIVHVGDHWYIGRAGKGTLKIEGAHSTGAVDTFPGSTAALIEATREMIKTGKTSMIDSLGATRLLNGEEKMIQRLAGIKDPTSFVAGDVSGDGKADFVVCSGGSVRLFVSDGESYAHATEKFGLSDVKGKKVELYSKWRSVQDESNAAIGIIVDGAEYELTGGKFSKVTADKATRYRVKQPGGATALGNFGDTDDVYQIEVVKEGVKRAKHSAKEIAADGVRLTGGNITEYHTEQKTKGFVNFQCTAIDANGDGKDDLFIRADGGNLLLINRGFGAFLVDRDSGSTLKHGGILSSGRLARDSKNESLLLLADDGAVYAVDTKHDPAP